MHKPIIPRTRWITIGTVRKCYVVIRNCGYPGGYRIQWRGRVSWCQPEACLSWETLLGLIRVRLRLARLEYLELECDLLDTAEMDCDVRVLVRRKKKNPGHTAGVTL